MKKLFTIILMVSLASMAKVTDNKLDRSKVGTYLRSGHDNTAIHFIDIAPIERNGKLVCAYARKVELPATHDGRCPDVHLYRLTSVTGNRDGTINCGYEYTHDGATMFTVYDQTKCPDIVASENGFKFFKNIFFDADDMHYMYSDGYPLNEFSASAQRNPSVRKQVKYRDRHMFRTE